MSQLKEIWRCMMNPRRTHHGNVGLIFWVGEPHIYQSSNSLVEGDSDFESNGRFHMRNLIVLVWLSWTNFRLQNNRVCMCARAENESKRDKANFWNKPIYLFCECSKISRKILGDHCWGRCLTGPCHWFVRPLSLCTYVRYPPKTSV